MEAENLSVPALHRSGEASELWLSSLNHLISEH